jgi:hypothetical protein
MSKSRGFKELKGVKITKVDETCVNFVVLEDGDGHRYVINAEIEDGIPILTLNKVKKPKNGEWPFPVCNSDKKTHDYD